MYIIQSNQIFDLRFFPRLNQRIKIFSILVKNSPSYSNFNFEQIYSSGYPTLGVIFFLNFLLPEVWYLGESELKIWITRWMLNQNLKFVKPLVHMVQAGSI